MNIVRTSITPLVCAVAMMAFSSTADAGYYTVKTNGGTLKLRSSPTTNTDNNITARMPNKAKVYFVRYPRDKYGNDLKNGKWRKVRWNGIEGWAARKYLVWHK